MNDGLHALRRLQQGVGIGQVAKDALFVRLQVRDGGGVRQAQLARQRGEAISQRPKPAGRVSHTS